MRRWHWKPAGGRAKVSVIGVQTAAAAIQADKDFALGCQQRSATILPFVDTVSAARDMDLIRAAVGDAKLSYLGLSYGTYLGQTYAHLFPTRNFLEQQK